jgi:hypothetical protein
MEALHDDMTDMTLTRCGLVSVLNIIMCVDLFFDRVVCVALSVCVS